MTRPRKTAKRPSKLRHIAELSSYAAIANRSSTWIDTDEEMENADVQGKDFENSDTEQDAAQDDDSELTVLTDRDEALLTIQTNWGIKRLEEVIKEGTWLKGMSRIDKIQGTNDIKFEDATILAARDLAEVSIQKKAHVQAEMVDMWKDRDKARVPGQKVGASWQDKQKNMRVDFGRLRAKMAANLRLADDTVDKKAAAPKTKGNKTLPEPSESPRTTGLGVYESMSPRQNKIDNQKCLNTAPQDEQPQDNADSDGDDLIIDSSEVNQQNNSSHPAQNESSAARPPSHPSSPIQRGQLALIPLPASQAAPRKPTKVDQIEWEMYKANQNTAHAESALTKEQNTKKALHLKRGATAYEYTTADRRIAEAAAQIEKTLLAQEKLAKNKTDAEFEEEEDDDDAEEEED
ncbi:hypothetical protein BDU57DRAFT_532915 [Ampelomyces quisqualis]|uniref:Uncharacterized protein n=1 Tax=Ampelomyces quisqualis TaxID=50730 RepID=A0A6A5QAW9_AMPQU|nr:hypothetical protein BDU57DRAFT_532915 [Ampelomyces quisqualis]